MGVLWPRPLEAWTPQPVVAPDAALVAAALSQCPPPEGATLLPLRAIDQRPTIALVLFGSKDERGAARAHTCTFLLHDGAWRLVTDQR